MTHVWANVSRWRQIEEQFHKLFVFDTNLFTGFQLERSVAVQNRVTGVSEVLGSFFPGKQVLVTASELSAGYCRCIC